MRFVPGKNFSSSQLIASIISVYNKKIFFSPSKQNVNQNPGFHLTKYLYFTKPKVLVNFTIFRRLYLNFLCARVQI